RALPLSSGRRSASGRLVGAGFWAVHTSSKASSGCWCSVRRNATSSGLSCWTSGRRSTSNTPSTLEVDCPVPGAYACVPRHLDRALHALVRRTAERMRRQRSLGRIQRVAGHSQLVMHVDRANLDGLAVADDTALHRCREGVTIERDLAPCQGATQSAEHSAGDAGHDVVERRGDRRPFPHTVILAEDALHTIDDRLAYLAETGVPRAVLVEQASLRDVFEVVGHRRSPQACNVRSAASVSSGSGRVV